MKRTKAKGAGVVIAMLGKYGSLAFDGKQFYTMGAENVPVVNTVGAGDSYIAAFTYGVSLGEDIQQCMLRGKTRATRIIQQFNPYI
jgi:fructoselysine 6-kinase